MIARHSKKKKLIKHLDNLQLEYTCKICGRVFYPKQNFLVTEDLMTMSNPKGTMLTAIHNILQDNYIHFETKYMH